jgi:hypothetical protein
MYEWSNSEGLGAVRSWQIRRGGIAALSLALGRRSSSCYCCCDASALLMMAIFGVRLLAGGCRGWRGRDDTHKNTHATQTAHFVVVVVDNDDGAGDVVEFMVGYVVKFVSGGRRDGFMVGYVLELVSEFWKKKNIGVWGVLLLSVP